MSDYKKLTFLHWVFDDSLTNSVRTQNGSTMTHFLPRFYGTCNGLFGWHAAERYGTTSLWSSSCEEYHGKLAHSMKLWLDHTEDFAQWPLVLQEKTIFSQMTGTLRSQSTWPRLPNCESRKRPGIWPAVVLQRNRCVDFV